MTEGSSTDLNAEQKERLARELPDLSLVQVEELAKIFKRLQRSERFLFFKRVPFSKLCGENWVAGSAGEVWTLEDMVLRGACEICLQLRVDSQQLSTILEIFKRLLAGDEESDEHHGDDASLQSEAATGLDGAPAVSAHWERRNTVIGTQQTIPVYSSVEAARLLSQALQRLRAEKDEPHLARHQVGEFWDGSIASGPFLEELTFLELSDLSAEHILKKRSFTGTKLFLLLNSIDAFLRGDAALSRDSSSDSVCAGQFDTSRGGEKQSRRARAEGRVIMFPRLQLDLPLSELAMVALLERVAPQSGDAVDEDPLLSMLHCLAQHDFLDRLAMLIVAEQNLLEARILEREHEDLLVEMRSIVELECKSLVKHVRTLLLGAGCDEAELLAEYTAPDLGSELSTILIRLLLASIGATELRWEGLPEKRFWSARGDAFEHLSAAIRSRQSDTRDEIETFFRFLAPHLPVSMLDDMLSAPNEKQDMSDEDSD